MKKTLLALLFASAASASHAQYFVGYYQHPVNCNLTDGFNTRIGVPAYITMGNNDDTYTIDRISTSGTYTGGFSRQYTFYSSGGLMVQQQGGSIVESNIGGGHTLALATANPEGFCFGIMQSNGNISVMRHYPLGTGAIAERALLANSTQTPGAEFFISGRYNNQMYVAKVNSGGTILWSNWYTMNGITNIRPTAIIQSRTAPYDVVVVGATNFVSPMRNDDAFFMRLDPATGSVSGLSLFGTAAQGEGFTSVMESANPASPGYVIGGQVSGTSWGLKVNSTGTGIVWNYIYNATGTTSQALTAIAERVNTSGAYEYYAVCRDLSNKALVYKLASNGMPVGMTGAPADQFQYTAATASTPSWQTTGVDIDTYSYGTTSLDGISVFGYVTNPGLPGSAHYSFLARTYFNGVVGCGATLLRCNTSAGRPMLPASTVSVSAFTITPEVIVMQVGNLATPQVLCMTEFLPTGSNARKAQAGLVQELTVQPNPVTDQFTISGPVAEGDGTVRVELTDMLGRSVYTQTFEGMTSAFSFSLNRGNLNCPAGMYLLNVYNGGQRATRRIVFAAQ